MAEFYLMPSVSPTMEVGTLVAWRVAEGDAFESQAVLAEIGTDKANMEAEIFDKGVLIKHLIAEGDEVPAGYPIAIWGQSTDEDVAGLLAEFDKVKAAGVAAASTAEAPAASAEAPKPDASPKPVATPAAAPLPKVEARTWMGKTLSHAFLEPPGDQRAARAERRVVASPLARAVGADLGVDLGRVKGSGPGGRVVRADVQSAAAAPSATAAAVADQVVRNSPMRKTIARRLLQSHTETPVFFLTVTLDMQGFVDLRAQLKAQMPDVRASYNDMLIKAVARALRDVPECNASWANDAITRHGRVDIGMAVALPDGLITPVIRNADTAPLSTIGEQTRELAARARAGKLLPEEYTGGTMTISNLGMMDIREFTAIINPPEAAILAAGEIAQVPVVVGGQLTVGWRMNLTMTCDHRVIDGALGARFLQALRRYVENPVLMLV